MRAMKEADGSRKGKRDREGRLLLKEAKRLHEPIKKNQTLPLFGLKVAESSASLREIGASYR